MSKVKPTLLGILLVSFIVIVIANVAIKINTDSEAKAKQNAKTLAYMEEMDSSEVKDLMFDNAVKIGNKLLSDFCKPKYDFYPIPIAKNGYEVVRTYNKWKVSGDFKDKYDEQHSYTIVFDWEWKESNCIDNYISADDATASMDKLIIDGATVYD